MDTQVCCFLVLLLVAGSQCAPKKIGGGVDFGGSGEASFTAGGSLKGTLDGKLLDAGATGLLGVNGNGGLHGGAFGRVDDNIYGTNGEIHGKGGLLGKSVFDGKFGMDRNGVVHAGGTNRLTGANEFGAGASGNILTGEDAKPYLSAYGGRSAMEDLHNNY